MPHEMSIDDIRQKFEGSVVMYQKKPVLFKKVGGDFSCRIFDLMAQTEAQVEFDMKAFQPPPSRIGFVNINGSVLYAVRNAIRRYKLGISKENFNVQQLPVPYPDGRSDVYIRLVAGLERRELGEAILNKYPTLQQAIRRVSQFEGACAFDKQFAIDHHHLVYYKTAQVGLFIGGVIKFDEGFEHLHLLLNKGYEKSN
jgi:hypothetical protein